MCIEKLLALIPKNFDDRMYKKTLSWDAVEASLHLVLPDDYKEFINIYGSCVLGGLLRVYSPFAVSSNWNFFVQSEGIKKTRLWYKASRGDKYCPYPLHPEPEGLLAWADTIDGDHLFWRTVGPPGSWSIVLAEVKSSSFEIFETSTSCFLYELLKKQIKSNIFSQTTIEELYVFYDN